MTTTIGLLTFPRVQQLDLTGPYEVFASLPDTQLHLIWKTLTPITSATGLILTPTTTLAECPPLDIICIPGGIGINALLTDQTILDFVRTQAKTARYITSVCTGALLLGAAGLLTGKRATTHWSAMEFLPAFGAIPTHARVVRDGNLITGGGVTAGIDFALTLAAELTDQQTAESIQLTLEYAPAPPFTAGTPETAPPEALQTARTRSAASRAEREAIINQITAEPASKA
ncbi:DJ-1/PfpI family protein [Acidiphilium acidophilum]|uniref:DJ-1/PfpI family protein n=1 Tax=Acidiphilium acidophilum TaxID=76588 RepID=UPI002E8E61DB|nr:DJ-1/PfpI family protein [Acidiphilium acidophilum]